MPYGRRGSSRRRSFPRPIINSIKNVQRFAVGVTGTTTPQLLIKAVNTPASTTPTDVSQGCIVKAIYIMVDGCGLGGTGVLNDLDFYLIKNPGDNLTEPAPISVGTSNEKKFVFRQWHFMIMRNQDGNTPFHWEGWIRIPKRYQRFGTDDTLQLVHACTTGLTGHLSLMCIYKWYR